MWWKCTIIIFAFVNVEAFHQQPVIVESEASDKKFHSFPKNFSFGASSAAFQIEGGWNADGKGPSIWDNFVHDHQDWIVDHSNADVGPDSYHFYKKDVEALKRVGFGHYRFSISWARIFPYGPKVNEKAFDYYNQLIDELIVNNIEPVVTLHHYDTPQWVQDYGGFLNVNIMKFFKLYADTVFKTFGSRVKIWLTFNEPNEFCSGYASSNFPPMVDKPGIGPYLCAHNVLLAHAAAFHLYKKTYAKDQRGILGITLDGRFYMPKNSSVNQSVADRALNFETGWFGHPIYSETGGYPQVMIDEINERSKREGLPWSRLPEMSEQTKDYIKGSADFLGYNYYSSRFVEFDSSGYDPTEAPSHYKDSRIIYSIDSKWKRAKSEWLYSVPEGLRGILNWFKKEYKNIPVMITENGWSDDGQLEDDDRIEYLRSHLTAVSNAINEDNCNVIGHTTWSVIDNFEWLRGYTEHFGLHAINMTSPEKERIPKKSVGFLRDVIGNRFV